MRLFESHVTLSYLRFNSLTLDALLLAGTPLPLDLNIPCLPANGKTETPPGDSAPPCTGHSVGTEAGFYNHNAACTSTMPHFRPRPALFIRRRANGDTSNFRRRSRPSSGAASFLPTADPNQSSKEGGSVPTYSIFNSGTRLGFQSRRARATKQPQVSCVKAKSGCPA